MRDKRIQITNNTVTHIVSWSSDIGGYTYCDIAFAWNRNHPQTQASCEAKTVESDCDCMTCLVESNRNITWRQEPGVVVINPKSIDKIKLLEEK